jgi:DNA-binding NarL/FixJ family response regulator
LIRKLRSEKHPIKLLIVSMHDEALYADLVLRAGGNGYIMKQEDPEEIIQAIRDVLAGRIYVSEEVLGHATGATAKSVTPATGRPIDRLTDAERGLLKLLGQGRSPREIARQLALSSRAVGARATQIRRKLRLKNLNALVGYAVCWVERNAACFCGALSLAAAGALA